MKKLLLLLSFIFMSNFAFSQGITINQSIVEPGPYKVGDVITIKYNINSGTQTPRYLWLRYQYNNKILTPVANSTIYSQGNSVQTFSTEWVNFKFTPSNTKPATSLYEQYQTTPWNYAANADWNVGQLTIQRTDAKIDGDFVSQKFTIKDNIAYNDIHQLSIGYAINASSQNISSVTTTGTPISLGTVTGGSSSFKVKVAFPTGYTNIIHHTAQIMRLKNDNSGDIDWSQQPIAQLPLDATGEATFTTQVKIGDEVGVFISPASQKPFMNDIVTVSDAYRAFLGHSQTDIAGTANFFTYPTLERNVGNITIGDNVFNESDSYYMFAHLMGINVSTNALIPTSTATTIRWNSGLLEQTWLNGTPKNKVSVTSNNQTVNMVYAWGGDLNWSHSTDPAVVAQTLAGNRTSTPKYLGSYSSRELEDVNLGVSSKLEGGKVILTTTLTKQELAGLQIIMKYDNTKLKLDNIIFDTGNTITNFYNDFESRLSFGSIDQLKTARIKTGTPYKLVFTPLVNLTSTTGLFMFELADAVDKSGNKVNLIIQ
jgi:hypothetical protein